MELLTLHSESVSSARDGTGNPSWVADHSRRPPWSWRHGLAALLAFLLGSLLPGAAGASEFDEYAVNAAYLYNFAKYVEWPPGTFASADAPLLICIVGDNPFGDALAALSGKTVGDHPVEVRHIPTAMGLDQCHVVFVGRAEQGRFKALLAKLARQPILTVSDISDFAQTGGIIGLVEADQRIRFDINLTATRQAHLKLSSQLLKLATIVE